MSSLKAKRKHTGTRLFSSISANFGGIGAVLDLWLSLCLATCQIYWVPWVDFEWFILGSWYCPMGRWSASWFLKYSSSAFCGISNISIIWKGKARFIRSNSDSLKSCNIILLFNHTTWILLVRCIAQWSNTDHLES